MVEFTLCEMSMNVVHVVRGAVKGALVAWTSANSRRLLVRVLCDEEGSYLVLFAFLMPVLVGVAGLGTEGGLWLYTQQALQGAADSAAVSAAYAYANNSNVLTQAQAITATYGLVCGSGVTCTVNQPPKSGNYTTNPDAIEVILARSQKPLFSSIWSTKSFNIEARSVALAPQPCGVLALDPSVSGAVTLAFLARVNLTGCPLFSDSSSGSSIDLILAVITATGNGGTVGTVGNVSDFCCGISPTPTTGDKPITDPYLSVPLPTFTVPKNQAGCTGGGAFSSKTPAMPKNGAVLNPGVYCEGIILSGVSVTMNPGMYILYALDSNGTLQMTNSTLTGNGGVTLVFTGAVGSSYETMSVDADSTINLTAPTTGPTAGMVMYGDRNMPPGNAYTFALGAFLNATGAVYLPRGNVTFAGIAGSTANCTLLIADKITFFGFAGIQDECSGVGTFSIATPGAVALVE
jgi:Flp pilus assembly protein TadG